MRRKQKKHKSTHNMFSALLFLNALGAAFGDKKPPSREVFSVNISVKRDLFTVLDPTGPGGLRPYEQWPPFDMRVDMKNRAIVAREREDAMNQALIRMMAFVSCCHERVTLYCDTEKEDMQDCADYKTRRGNGLTADPGEFWASAKNTVFYDRDLHEEEVGSRGQMKRNNQVHSAGPKPRYH